jgi:ABC-type branched-subunit amino acid transport system substrate-binding protein
MPAPEPVIAAPVEPEPEPVEVVEEAYGLIPPHMQDRDLARVAVLLPFSAENAGARAEALRLLRAAELALFERAGGNLVLIPKDTGGNADGARQAALAAVEDGADLIIGPLFAPAVTAAGDVARRAGVPVIAFSTDTTTAGDGVYLLSFPPEIEVERIVEYAARQGVWRYAYLGSQNRYGMAVYNALQDTAAVTAGEVTAEAFYTGDVEAMARASSRLAEGAFPELTPDQARELRRRQWIPDPEAAFQAVILPEGGTRLRALGPLLISQQVDPLVVRFLGTGLWNDEDLLREPALHGGWFAGPDLQMRERFDTAYEAAFGSEPSRIASLAYDAMALAAHMDGGELGFSREAIEEEQGFLGADGLFRFNSDGLIERGLAIYEVRSRGFRQIEPAPLDFETPLFDPEQVRMMAMAAAEERVLRYGMDEDNPLPDYLPLPEGWGQPDEIETQIDLGTGVALSDTPLTGPADQGELIDPELAGLGTVGFDYSLFRREMPEDYPRPGDIDCSDLDEDEEIPEECLAELELDAQIRPDGL